MGSDENDERPETPEAGVPVVVKVESGGYPHAKVFAWPNRPRSKAQVKRDRFVHNLRGQYRQLKEALAAAERFFVIASVGEAHLAAIRKAHAEALDDLSRRFQAKLNEYDRRITGGG